MTYLGAHETFLTEEGDERRPVGHKLGLSLPFLRPPTFPRPASLRGPLSCLSPTPPCFPSRPPSSLSFLFPLLTLSPAHSPLSDPLLSYPLPSFFPFARSLSLSPLACIYPSLTPAPPPTPHSLLGSI